MTAVALVLSAPGFSPAGPVPGPGTPDMRNLEHVYNFAFPDTELTTDHATDLFLYTSDAPLRDYSTGEKILDPDGNEIIAPRDFAIVGGAHRGAYVFDVTDPEETQFVREIVCVQHQNDVQIKRFGDRWVLALALDDGLGRLCLPAGNGSRAAGGISLFDVTDPYEYEPLEYVSVPAGAHNFTFHPTQPFGWVSTGEIPGHRALLPIIDFTDLEAPVIVAQLPTIGGGPHDIVFDAAGTRGYVASANNLRIYDATDPANPQLVGATTNATTYLHDASPSPDGTVMVATGESLVLGGFFTEPTAGGVCPGEGLTVYSIEGALETAPAPLGYYLPDLAGPSPDHRSCTAHNGLFASPSVYVMGWYIGGVRVVDLSNPARPTEIGRAVMPGAEVWAARTYKGPYVYASDMGRGFDVFRWTGEQPIG